MLRVGYRGQPGLRHEIGDILRVDLADPPRPIIPTLIRSDM